MLKMMLCNATTAAALRCIKFPRLHLLQPIIQDLRERPAVGETRDVIHRPVQRIVHVAKIKLDSGYWIIKKLMFKTNYHNKVFQKEVVELDDHSFKNCEFKECMIVTRRGETELKSCRFVGCQLILKENALNIGKIITMFTGKNPLKVVDFDDQGKFYPQENQEKK